MVDEEHRPRLCIVRKWHDFPGYGFNLHAERGRAGQYIGKVDDGSPAQAAGMKEGDRIVEVNGTNIGNENHSQVVTRIKASGETVTMLLVDTECDKYYKDQKIVVSSEMSEVDRIETPPHPQPDEDDENEMPPPPPETDSPSSEPPSYNDVQQDYENVPEPEPEREPSPEPEPVVGKPSHSYHPRLCHLRKWPDFQGYGFNLHAEKDKKGQYIGLIDANSPSEDADLRKGDRIIEVDGVNIEDMSHQEVIQRIKAGGDETRMLVVDSEADEYYKNNGIRVRSDMPEVIMNETRKKDAVTVTVNSAAPKTYIPRECYIIKWPDFNGYGFNLHAEKERGGQYIGKIDANSPAESAGLLEHDRIIEVNGHNIENETHQQVIARIKAGGDETRLLVVDREADKYYKEKGITVTSKMPEVKFRQSERRSTSGTVANGESKPATSPAPVQQTQPTRVPSKKKAPAPPSPTEEEIFNMSAHDAKNIIQRKKSDKRLARPNMQEKVNMFDQL